jgi:hypothetical protein
LSTLVLSHQNHGIRPRRKPRAISPYKAYAMAATARFHANDILQRWR